MATLAILEIDLDLVGQQQLILGLNLEISSIFQQILTKAYTSLTKKIPNLIKDGIITSPEYQAMQPGGILYGQIGRRDIESILENIIEEILREIQIIPLPLVTVGDIISGIIEINILELSFSKILGVSGTSFVSEGKYASLVEWLRWLLFDGDRKMVIGFNYFQNKKTPLFSRTETGIMRKSRSGGWGFEPKEFSGTGSNNWLTRAMDNIFDELIFSIEEEFRKAAS